MNAAVELIRVGVDFGGVRALDGVDLRVGSGELVGMIGPNGSGKTTVMNLISGSIQPNRGEIRVNSKAIRGKRPDELHRWGVSRTFQNIRLFPNLSVYENVSLGLHSRPGYPLWDAFFRTHRAREAESATRIEVNELLVRVGLRGLAEEKAGNLPYGMQRRVEIARAIASRPILLLLDEPAAGMNDDECSDMVKLISELHQEYHFAILLIEHHMNVVMQLCAKSRLVVLHLGRILASGSPEEIQNHPEVVRVYLGSRRKADYGG